MKCTISYGPYDMVHILRLPVLDIPTGLIETVPDYGPWYQIYPGHKPRDVEFWVAL